MYGFFYPNSAKMTSFIRFKSTSLFKQQLCPVLSTIYICFCFAQLIRHKNASPIRCKIHNCQTHPSKKSRVRQNVELTNKCFRHLPFLSLDNSWPVNRVCNQNWIEHKRIDEKRLEEKSWIFIATKSHIFCEMALFLSVWIFSVHNIDGLYLQSRTKVLQHGIIAIWKMATLIV